MPTTGTDILSYRGDPGLGSGSNPQIPVSATKDLDTINRTGQILLYQNMAQNKALFDQKIKDRDTLLQAIDSGDIKVGDLLEEDTPLVKEGLQKLDEAFFNRVKKGINDIDAAREYKKALREAQDRVTQAQGRKVFYDTESQVLAKETLPRKQEARRKNLDNVIKGGFWKDITPYQQTLDMDFDPIKAYVKPITTEIADPRNPLFKTKRTIVDADQVKKEATKDFLEKDNEREYQIGLLQEHQNLPANEQIAALTAIQNRLMEYNKQRGIEKGQPGYQEIQIARNPDGSPLKTPDGKFIIKESVPDFAAKWALAQHPVYQQDASEFDSKYGTYKLGEERNRIAAMKGRAYVDNLRQQMSIRKTQQEKDAYLDEQWVRNFTNQKTLIEPAGKENHFYYKYLNADESLPIYTIKNREATELIPFGATPVVGSDKKLRYYKGGYYKTQYFFNGKPIGEKTLTGIYEEMKKQQGNKWQGSFDDFLKLSIASKDEKVKVRVTLRGQNGTSDEELSRAAQQLISNQGTKKGQVGVFDNSEEPVDEEQVQEIQTNIQRERENQ